MATFKLNIVTPEGKSASFDLKGLSLPTSDGVRTILANHMEVFLPVEIGVIKLIKEDKPTEYAVSSGLFHFKDNVGQLMVSTFESPDEIDINRAKKAQERAEKRLALKEENLDLVRAEASLKRALSRQRISK